MKKLEHLAMVPGHPHYEQAIQREISLYTREHDKRSPFGRDYTRIIFTSAYRRLRNKTQVFFAVDNDHVCTRSEHVNLVESISYTIAKELGLNTELTKAIAVGHDIGHAPFGHGGERILDELAKQNGLDGFWHERNSLHFVDHIELLEDDAHNQHNLCLTYAVRDGIISHCGEVNQRLITPRQEAIDLNTYHKPGAYDPYTYEACVVKMSDKIAYLGRDIEDALKLKVIDEGQVIALRDRLNEYGVQFQAINNGSIVNYFICDVIENSSEAGIGLSPTAYTIMKEILAFNYQYIYVIKRVQVHTNYVKLLLTSLFDLLYDYGLSDGLVASLKADELSFPKTLSHYLSWLEKYALIDGITRSERQQNMIVYDFKHDPQAFVKSVIDYLSGMTDTFLIAAFNELLLI